MENFSEMPMTTTVLDPLVVIEDPVQVVDDGQRPDPEVPQRARRRTFTAKYKLWVLAAYDAASGGEKGAVLRREGLYSSHIGACGLNLSRHHSGVPDLAGAQPSIPTHAVGDDLEARSIGRHV